MNVYHAEAPGVRRRPFVRVAYLPGGESGWSPSSLPDRCPLLIDATSVACSVHVDHVRKRKTGTCLSLVVMRCRRHGCAFTLYPCGFAPYARVPIAPVDPRGTPVIARVEGDRIEEPLAAWRGTPFEAALDAARGTAWPRSEGRTKGATRWWRTQGRWIGLAALLVGLVALASDPVAVAAQLNVPALTMRDASQAYAAARGYRARGAVIVHVLSLLKPSRRTAERLFASGAHAGRWGAPLSWDPIAHRLRPCAFRASGVPP